MSSGVREKHPLARQIVVLNLRECKVRGFVNVGIKSGDHFWIEDWAQNVDPQGRSWHECDGNIAACQYALRAGLAMIPHDNEVVYGKINGLGYLVHASEIGEVVGWKVKI